MKSVCILGSSRTCKALWKKSLELWPGAELRDHAGAPLTKLPTRFEWTALNLPRGQVALEGGVGTGLYIYIRM